MTRWNVAIIKQGIGRIECAFECACSRRITVHADGCMYVCMCACADANGRALTLCWSALTRIAVASTCMWHRWSSMGTAAKHTTCNNMWGCSAFRDVCHGCVVNPKPLHAHSTAMPLPICHLKDHMNYSEQVRHPYSMLQLPSVK